MELRKINFKKIPQKPGVYFFKDKNGKVLYVGKAASLRVRVKQYFHDEVEAKIAAMLTAAKDLSFIAVNSDLQAVILEAKLIKTYQPKYNSLLKDGKRHLYLGVTKDKYPRLKFLRRPELENLSFWAGPFPSSATLKQILRRVRKIFPYCSCKSSRKNPCLNYQLGLCLGPEIVSVSEYKKMIKKLTMFLSGESDKVLKTIQKEMLFAAKNLDFEKATILKNQIVFLQQILYSRGLLAGEEVFAEKGLKQLRKILAKYQKINPSVLRRIEAYDIANFGEKIIVGAFAVLENGETTPNEYRLFKIYGLKQDDPACLAQVLARRLKHQEWVYPQLILIDGGKGQLSAVAPVFKKFLPKEEVGLVGLTKEEEVLIIPRFLKGKIFFKKLKLPRNSFALKLLQTCRDEAHRFANNYLKGKLRINPLSNGKN